MRINFPPQTKLSEKKSFFYQIFARSYWNEIGFFINFGLRCCSPSIKKPFFIEQELSVEHFVSTHKLVDLPSKKLEKTNILYAVPAFSLSIDVYQCNQICVIFHIFYELILMHVCMCFFLSLFCVLYSKLHPNDGHNSISWIFW